jgi:hypothetical protein
MKKGNCFENCKNDPPPLKGGRGDVYEYLRNLILPISIFFSIATISCQIGKGIGKVGEGVNRISHTIDPADTLAMDLVSGLLAGLSTDTSKARLDSVSARINRALALYLNETFQKLDPGPVGKKLTEGALDPILAGATEQRIKDLIHAVSTQAGDDLSAAIKKVIAEAASDQNKAKLNSVLSALLSDVNADAISAFVNRSLNQIRFDTLGQNLAGDVIADQLKPEIDSLVRTAVRAIFDEIQKDENAKGFFSGIKDILFLGLGLVGLIIGGFMWWNRRKYIKLTRLLMHSVEDLPEEPGKAVKKAIEKQARDQGMLQDVDNVLEKEHLLKRSGRRG